jgi:hypothetical protein
LAQLNVIFSEVISAVTSSSHERNLVVVLTALPGRFAYPSTLPNTSSIASVTVSSFTCE